MLSGGLLPPLLVTFGISIIIQNGLLQGFGAYDHRLKEGAIETASVHLPNGIDIGISLGMVDQQEYINPPAGAASMAAAATNTELNVTFGKTKRLVLTKNANGSDASWVEVTVNEIGLKLPPTEPEGRWFGFGLRQRGGR